MQQATLLRLGADADSRNWQGDTALHSAAMQGYSDIVKILLGYSASKITRLVQSGLASQSLYRRTIATLQRGKLCPVSVLSQEDGCLRRPLPVKTLLFVTC